MKLSKIYKARTYKRAKSLCPKGYYLPERWELMKLLDEGKGKKLMNAEEGWRFFWSNTVIRNLVACANLYSDGSWNSVYEGLVRSDDVGRVVFFKSGGEGK